MPGSIRKILTIPRLPARRRDAHKGDFGRVLVAAGSPSMPGAAALCAMAALRGGAGLVRVMTDESVVPIVAALAPCATFVPLPNEAKRRTAALRGAIDPCDVVAAGPGWGVSPASAALLEALLDAKKPLVLDADGLNVLCTLRNWPQRVMRRTAQGHAAVLTPHPGEFRRLVKGVDRSVRSLDERQAAAMELAKRCGGIVVLKGAGTVVTDGARVYVNRTGNPGMATGGSGDVLTGLIGSLIAQRLEPLEAAVLGVWLHGLAGDAAARDKGEASLIATDLIDRLPDAFTALSAPRGRNLRPAGRLRSRSGRGG